MKLSDGNLEDMFEVPIVFILVDNHLTALPLVGYLQISNNILHGCGINSIEQNNSAYLSFEQILALKGLIDNHDTYKNIAILVEL